jgi:hypothetical protein
VLFGKLLAVRLGSDMRDKHGAAVADHSWANQVVGDLRILRAAPEHNAIESNVAAKMAFMSVPSIARPRPFGTD